MDHTDTDQEATLRSTIAFAYATGRQDTQIDLFLLSESPPHFPDRTGPLVSALTFARCAVENDVAFGDFPRLWTELEDELRE